MRLWTFPLFALTLAAQTPSFEVASIKPHIKGSGYLALKCANGRLSSQGLPLLFVIQWAFDLNTDQGRDLEEHLPKWLSPTTAFDIEATAGKPVGESECRKMTQALLKDRFNLATHWEPREVRANDLVVDGKGVKLQRADDAIDDPQVRIALNGRPLTGARAGQPKGMTMQELADFLTSGMRNEPIINKTELEGRYKIDLRFSIQPTGAKEPLEDPDLESALLRQLGLKLIKQRATINFLRIDSLDPPTEN
jgi:uncharacterized protein (TIGR03435 family)